MTLLLTLMLAGLGLQSTTRSTDPPPTRPAAVEEAEPAAEEVRRQAEEEIREILAQQTASEPGVLSDLLDARMEDGFLIVELKEEPLRWPVIMPLSDRRRSVVQISELRRPRLLTEEESPARSRFRMVVNHLGEPNAEVYATNVELYTGAPVGHMNLHLTRAWAGGSINVTLVQLPAGLEAEEAVKLHIVVDRAGDGDDTYELVTAQSFADLSRRHPERFEEYVRPILAELGLEAVLSGNVRKVATQIFLADLPVEPELLQKVQGLLRQLDDADFARRDEAQEALEALGRPGATALLQLSRDAELSLEQSARVSNILAAHRPLAAEELASRLEDRQFLQQVAALEGEPEAEALAKLARARLQELGDAPATRPAGE